MAASIVLGFNAIRRGDVVRHRALMTRADALALDAGGGDDVRMADAHSTRVERPARARGRWTSFVADEQQAGRAVRGLHEQGNPNHRVRVEHDRVTLLVHLSDEDGDGWTTIAIDRGSRAWSVAQRLTQREAAAGAVDALYGPDAAPERMD
jgi:hypothetical protein